MPKNVFEQNFKGSVGRPKADRQEKNIISY